MTRDEVMSLEGRPLSEAVAVACFGYTWWRSTSGRRGLYAPGKNPAWMKTPADMTELLVFDYLHHDMTPRYAEDGGAMLLLLARLGELGWHYRIESGVQDEAHDVLCRLRFCHGGQFSDRAATGNTLAEAVARAALLACGGGK